MPPFSLPTPTASVFLWFPSLSLEDTAVLSVERKDMDDAVGAVQGDLEWQRGGPGKREEQTQLDCSLGDRDPPS